MANGDLGTSQGYVDIDIGRAQAALRTLERDYQRVQNNINGYTGKTIPLLDPQVDRAALASVERAHISANARVASSQEAASARVRSVELQSAATVEKARLASAAKVEAAQVAAANRAALQEQRLAAQSARQGANGPVLPRSVEFFGEGAVQQIGQVAAGLLTVEFAARAATAAFDAGRQGLALRRTEASVQLLAGTTENYADIVRLAREQQSLFGGSLQQNIAQIGQLGGIANRTGVDLAELNDIAQRLVIKDPTANFGDAAVALSEAFSGDTTSLAERFELDRKALAGLRGEGVTAADRLRILDQVLNENGVRAGAAAQAIDDTSRAYNEFGAAVSNTTATAGAGLADFFAFAARGATNLLTGSAANTQALQTQNAAIAASAGSYQAYITSVQQLDAANRGVLGSFTQLTPAQYEAAAALRAQGVAAAQAVIQIASIAPTFTNTLNASLAANPALREHEALLLQIASASPEAANGVLLLVREYINSGGPQEAFLQGLRELPTTLTQAGDQTQYLVGVLSGLGSANVVAANTTADLAAATNKQAVESVIAAAQSEALAAAQARIQSAAIAAAGGAGTLEARAATLASQLGITNAEALQLIGTLGQLNNVARGFAGGKGATGSPDRFATASVQQAEAQRRIAQETAKAQQAAILATGSHAQKVAELTRQRNQYVKGTPEYIRANTALIQAQQGAPKASKTPKGAKGNAASDADARLAAQRALMSDQQLLTSYTAEYNAIRNKGSTEALQLEKQIRDVRERIATTNKQAADARKREAEAAQQEAEQAQERYRRAEEALMDDSAILARRRAEFAATTDATRRLELTAEIKSLEESIARTREEANRKALQAQQDIINTQIDAINEERTIRDENKDLAEAEKVLRSGATAEMKREAELVKEEIRLRRQLRELDNQPVAGAQTVGITRPNVPTISGGLTTPTTAIAPPANLPVAAPSVVGGAGVDASPLIAAIQEGLRGASFYLNGVLTPQNFGIAFQDARAGVV